MTSTTRRSPPRRHAGTRGRRIGAVHLAIAYDGSASAATAIDAAAKQFPGARATVLTARARSSVTSGMAGVAVPTMSPDLVQRTLDEIDAEADDEAGQTVADGV